MWPLNSISAPTSLSVPPAAPQKHPPGLRILGSRVDALSPSQAIAEVRRRLNETRAQHVVTANTLMLLSAQTDPELRRVLECAALVVPESSGVYWASRRLGTPLPGFLPGIDLFLALCALAEDLGQPVFLLGSKPGVADDAARTLLARHPRLLIAGVQHGYFSAAEEPAVLERLRASGAAFLFVGMGMPDQEKWIARRLEKIAARIVVGVGGSFDVLSGRLARAPGWMRRFGLEWLYRLAQEPWRWRRIAQLPVFAWTIERVAWKMAKGKWQMGNGVERRGNRE